MAGFTDHFAIREASAQDVDAIAQLGVSVQRLHRDKHPESFLTPDVVAIAAFFCEQIQRRDARLLVAVNRESSDVVGYALLIVVDKPANPFKPAVRFVELDQLAVDPAFEGRGIGSALTDAAIAFAREINAQETHLMVWHFNQRAVALYERSGFVKAQIRMIQRCR